MNLVNIITEKLITNTPIIVNLPTPTHDILDTIEIQG